MPIYLRLIILNVTLYFVNINLVHTSMRRGKVVGAGDKFVAWHKPQKCPQRLSGTPFLA